MKIKYMVDFDDSDKINSKPFYLALGKIFNIDESELQRYYLLKNTPQVKEIVRVEQFNLLTRLLEWSKTPFEARFDCDSMKVLISNYSALKIIDSLQDKENNLYKGFFEKTTKILIKFNNTRKIEEDNNYKQVFKIFIEAFVDYISKSAAEEYSAMNFVPYEFLERYELEKAAKKEVEILGFRQ